MGEFRNDTEMSTTASNDMEQTIDTEFQTDVPDVKSDSFVQHGKDKFPCFNVSYKSFYQNMNSGRRRIRFEKDTPVSKYFQGSKYQRKFYIKHTDKEGNSLIRSIK